MKKIILSMILVMNMSIGIFAQTPQAFNYQAVLRNSTGEELSYQDLYMRISILQGSISGTPVYVETHTTTSNYLGLVNLSVGSGTVISGSFSGIQWGTYPHFLKIEVDTTDGSSYIDLGTVQLLSVPYALYAKDVSTVSPSDVTHWNAAYGWGNHALVGYLTGFTETDPIFGISPASGILSSQITNWNTAYGWGNHASAGYLTAEVDGSTTNEGSLAVGAGGGNTSQIQSNTAGSSAVTLSGGTNIAVTEAGSTISISATGLEPAQIKGTLTETVSGLQFDQIRQVIGGDAVLSLTGGYVIPTTVEQSNWNTAYGWGNHALAGYLTSYTETDTGYWKRTGTNLIMKNAGDNVGIGTVPTTKLDVNGGVKMNSSVTMSGITLGGSPDTLILALNPVTRQVYFKNASDLGGGSGGGGGEVNTASNLGVGVGVFEQKSGVDLQFNSLASANTMLGIAENDAGDVITFTVNPSQINHNALQNYVAQKHFYQRDIDTVNTSLSGLLKSTSGVLTTIVDNSGNWNTAYSWGNHALAGYLTSYTETDPIFGASPASGILASQITNWNTAYSWGNHALAGYLTAEVDGSTSNEGSLTVAAGGGNTSEIHSNTSGSTNLTVSGSTNITVTESGNTVTIGSTGLEPAQTKGTLTETVAGLELDQTRQVIGGDAVLGLTGGYVIPTTTEQTSWNTAYGWGNHAAAGYLTSEVDGSTTNEGSLLVTAGGSNSSAIQSNTAGSGSVTIEGGASILVTESGNTITVAATGLGTGNVSKVGTPVNDQVAVWTGDGTIEGDADLTFDGNKLTAKQLAITSPTAGAGDYDQFLVLDAAGTEVKTRTGVQVLSDIGAEASQTKGTLTETVTGLQLDQVRQVIGGDAVLSLTGGYLIPTTTEQSNWNMAYGWGNHAMVGYLTAEVDGSTANELQTLSIAGDQLSISSGNTVTVPGDNWGAQVVTTDATLAGNGTAGNTLKIAQQGATSGQVLSWNGTTWVPGSVSATAWSLTGNSGTNPASNFLGTTDNQPLMFRVNNLPAGEINPVNNNTFIGKQAGENSVGYSNVAVGGRALFQNTTRSNLVAVGDSALFSNGIGASNSWESKENTAVGSKALYANTIGFNNTASGYRSLYSNTIGWENTASGGKALYANTEGVKNTANGSYALYSNINGYYNSALGNEALFHNISGNENTAMGYYALYSNTTGNCNTASGTKALHFNLSGSRNTANGFHALYSNTSGYSNVASGVFSLFLNTTRSNLVAVGDSALFYNGLGASESFHAIKNTAIGSKALYANTTGYKNAACGSWALYTNTVGNSNTAMGNESLFHNSIGNENTAVGNSALNTNTGGNGNTAVGSESLVYNTGGSLNIAIGLRALAYNYLNDRSTAIGVGAMFNADNNTSTTARNTFNTAIGYEALKGSLTPGNNTGRWNTAVGDEALNVNESGDYNTALGKSAIISNSTGSKNTALGALAMNSNTIGFSNVAVGYRSLYQNTTRNNLVAIGDSALYNNGLGASNSWESNENTAVGSKALYANTTGFNNTANGYRSLYSNTAGWENTASGSNALYSNTEGDNNTANGSYALYSNINGGFNSAVGNQALYKNTSGSNNTSQGYFALYSNTTGSFNTASGTHALYFNLSGMRNTANGFYALYSNTSGFSNAAIGVFSLYRNTIRNNLVAVGDSALYNNGFGAINSWEAAQNTAVGSKALYANSTGYNNTASGYRSLYSNTTGFENAALGCVALYSNTIGTGNTATGCATLVSNVSGNNNTATGSYSLYMNNTGLANTACGSYALYLNTTGNFNTGIGVSALTNTTSGKGNTSVGAYSLFSNTTGFSNVALGKDALFYNSTRSNLVAVGDSALFNNGQGVTEWYHATANTAVGSKALFLNTTGYNNTAIGSIALRLNSTGYWNTAVGDASLALNSSGSENTAVGRASLNLNTTGCGNTAMGTASISWNIGGSYNTAIGFRAMCLNNNNNRSTAIGVGAIGNADDNTTTSARNTYNTAVGYEALKGSVTAGNNTGRWNTAVGDQSMLSITSGDQNTASGHKSLFSNSTGYCNTAVGDSALSNNTTGNYNTVLGQGALSTADNTYLTGLGHNANVSSSSIYNSSVMGDAAVVNANAKVRIGDGSMTVIEGQVDWSYPSDGRFKNNVREEVKGLDFILKLRPVVYNFDTRKYTEFLTRNMPSDKQGEYLNAKDFSESSAIRHSGFVAQEVVEAAKAAGYDFNGVHVPVNEEDNYCLAPGQFVAPLVKAIQEQQAMIEELQRKVEALEKTLVGSKVPYEGQEGR